MHPLGNEDLYVYVQLRNIGTDLLPVILFDKSTLQFTLYSEQM